MFASAQPVCWPTTDLSSTSVIKFANGTEKVDWGQVVYSPSSAGLVWGYACKTNTSLHHYIFGGRWAQYVPEWAYIADTLMRGTDADKSAAYTKYMTGTTIDPIFQGDVDKIKAMLPLLTAPTEVWKVMADPFRADKKRLVYNVVSGKRGSATSPAQYVDAGAPCDPAVKITEFGPVYFLSVLGKPNLVARCVKQ